MNNNDKPRAEWWDKLPKECVRLMRCTEVNGCDDAHYPTKQQNRNWERHKESPWCSYTFPCLPIGFRAPDDWKYDNGGKNGGKE